MAFKSDDQRKAVMAILNKKVISFRAKAPKHRLRNAMKAVAGDLLAQSEMYLDKKAGLPKELHRAVLNDMRQQAAGIDHPIDLVRLFHTAGYPEKSLYAVTANLRSRGSIDAKQRKMLLYHLKKHARNFDWKGGHGG